MQRGDRDGYEYVNATRYRTLFYILGQVRTMACFRNQQAVAGRGGKLVYVRTNIDHNQTDSL